MFRDRTYSVLTPRETCFGDMRNAATYCLLRTGIALQSTTEM